MGKKIIIEKIINYLFTPSTTKILHMNRNNVLERHLLTRCYSSEARIEELLSTRYSITGDQRPSLLLMPTGQDVENNKTKALLHQERPKTSDEAHKTKKYNTRIELKNYIKNTLNNQQKVIKKIQAYNRLSKQNGKKKPFPILKLLEHYSIPMYEEFIPISNLWQDYMQNLLFPSANNKLPSLISILPKLSSADYHGCLLTVLKSTNRLLVGVRGIVVWDTQHSFILCVPRTKDSKEWNENKEDFTPSEQIGGLRIIPKKGCLFGFDVILPSNEGEEDEDECMGFTVIGSRFEFRSVDRSGKKFKNHNVDDIL